MPSHQPTLPDFCPNCNAARTGNFCANCGQRMELHHEGFWQMIVHFVGHYFHYDNKFWSTLRLLLFKPGSLTRAYFEGKRASFINPIQLYIFVSAIFFLLYTNTLHFYIDQKGNLSTFKFYVGKENPALTYQRSRTVDFDSLKQRHAVFVSDYEFLDSAYRATPFEFSGEYFNMLFGRNVIRFALDRGLYSNGEIGVALMNIFIKSIPKMFFILLPWFAFLLWLFFSQRRKFLYVDHAVFALHFHAFTFISVMLGVLLKYFPTGDWLPALFMAVIPIVYFFVALAVFYRRKWHYTVAVGLAVFVVYVASLVFLTFANMALVTLIA